MVLTDLAIRKIKAVSKPTKFSDDRGLFLLVNPNGSKLWRWKYRFEGKEKLMALGAYGEVTLNQARNARDEARLKLVKGIDPSAERKEAKTRKPDVVAESLDTFAAVSRAWMASREIADITAMKTRWILESFLLPELGERPIDKITARELLPVLRKIEATGKIETAKRAKITAGQVFRYAVIEGLADTDPTTSLRGALKNPRPRHHAAVTDPLQMGELLRAIDGFSGQTVTAYAIRIAPLVFVRPGELRNAQWSEIDLDGAM
jgi:hypothetical protein